MYLPDEMAEVVKSANLNVSALTQNAIRIALAQGSTNNWLATLDDSDGEQS